MKVKTIEENKKKIGEIGKELASIRSGGAALDGVEQDLRTAVSSCSVLVLLEA